MNTLSVTKIFEQIVARNIFMNPQHRQGIGMDHIIHTANLIR